MPKFEFREADTMEEKVYQALGAASTCWTELPPESLFDSTRCSEIGEVLLAAIREYTIHG